MHLALIMILVMVMVIVLVMALVLVIVVFLQGWGELLSAALLWALSQFWRAVVFFMAFFGGVFELQHETSRRVTYPFLDLVGNTYYNISSVLQDSASAPAIFLCLSASWPPRLSRNTDG